MLLVVDVVIVARLVTADVEKFLLRLFHFAFSTPSLCKFALFVNKNNGEPALLTFCTFLREFDKEYLVKISMRKLFALFNVERLLVELANDSICSVKKLKDGYYEVLTKIKCQISALSYRNLFCDVKSIPIVLHK